MVETNSAHEGSAERLTALQRRKRQVTVDALVGAAQRGLAEHGLDVTVDEIAALAEVGRRTVFRHFATREDVLEAAITASSENYLRVLPPYTGDDWQAWFADLARVAHLTAARSGRAVWEMRSRRLPPRIAATYAQQLQVLRGFYATTAATLWEAAGGHGPLPEPLRQTVAVYLSPLFTQTVLREADGTAEIAAEIAAELSTTAITATVRQLVNHMTSAAPTSDE